MTLFEQDGDAESGAVISDCGQYRYHLWRIWNRDLPTLVYVMQNPSTADASEDDATIRRCIGFAKRDGYGSISVKNVFALRATDERELLKHADPFGPENEKWLLGARDVSIMTRLVLAWGTRFGGKRLNWRYDYALGCLMRHSPYCLGTAKCGNPRHPLMLRADTPIVPFTRT